MSEKTLVNNGFGNERTDDSCLGMPHTHTTVLGARVVLFDK